MSDLDAVLLDLSARGPQDTRRAPLTPLHPVVLGIETSCDDTACAVLAGDGTVLSSVVSSQLEAHRPFGGVVPEIASREHLSNWPAVSTTALEKAGIELAEVDAVAATSGPGLVGALLVGLSLGKSIAFGLRRPFFAVHHLEGHLFSPFMGKAGEAAIAPPDQFVGLVVSGGHTSIYKAKGLSIRTVAETRDDAMGEVFDKVGKKLGLEYPQGPKVDELAESGEHEHLSLAVAQCRDGSLDFSYSGLKTQTLLQIENLEQSRVVPLSKGRDVDPQVHHLLASFRHAAVAQLLERLDRLFRDDPFDCLAVSGGAAANRLLRRVIPEWSSERGIDLRLVRMSYSGDNAAMIAHVALRRIERGESDDPLTAEASSRLQLATP